MTVIQSVRKHINHLQADTIIFTRDLLEHGTRASVDMCVHRLSLAGFVKRVSVGMYTRHDCSRNFTPVEIADAKKIWLLQRRLSLLSNRSPDLILSNSQTFDIEDFAPPALSEISLDLQSFVVKTLSPSPVSPQNQ